MGSISNNNKGSDKNQTNPSTTTADGNTISTKQPKEKQAETKAVPTPTGPPPNHSVKITKTGTPQLVSKDLKKGKKGKRVRKKNLTTDEREAYEAEKQKKADALDTERKRHKTTVLICG